MLLAAIIVVPLIVGVVAAASARRARARVALAGVGVILWVAILVYAVAIHHCPSGRHCDTGFLWFFGLFALFGWLIGLLAGSLLPRPSRWRTST